MESLIRIRNKANRFIYGNLLKPVFFMFDAEFMHKTFIKFGKFLGSSIFTKRFISLHYGYSNGMLRQKILGIDFRNPVGLSAGFDKNGEIISICEDVGFGFSEIGSVTAMKCDGNSGKRLDRIKERKSLWVNFGLNNKGVNRIVDSLKGKKFRIPYGVSIAKTNCKENVSDEKGKEDYVESLRVLNKNHVGDYYVLNISCPNAYGGQPFNRPGAYESY